MQRQKKKQGRGKGTRKEKEKEKKGNDERKGKCFKRKKSKKYSLKRNTWLFGELK